LHGVPFLPDGKANVVLVDCTPRKRGVFFDGRGYAPGRGIFSPEKCIFAFMKRQMLLVFVLLLCASRSWCAGELCSVSVDAPVSVCRYKKPFPFQCVRPVKKNEPKISA
jgi:hypothetical protein